LKLIKKKFPTRNSRVYRVGFVDEKGRIKREPPLKFSAYRWVKNSGKFERKWKSFKTSEDAVGYAGSFEDITPNPKGLTVRILVARFLWMYRRKVQRPTLDKMRDHIPHFESLFAEEVKSIGPNRIDRLIGHWKSPSYIERQKSTRTSYFCELRSLRLILRFFQSRFDNSYFIPILDEHRENISFRESAPKFRKDLLPEQVDLFLTKLDELFSEGTPWICVLARLQYYLGGRVQEPAALFFEDINFKEGTVTLKRRIQWSKRKGQRRKFVEELKAEDQRVQPSRKAAKLAQEWCFKNGIRSGPLFLEDGLPLKYKAIGYRYSKAFEKAGLPQRGTHILRHASITEFQESAKDIYLTKQFAGHKSVTTTEGYAKNRDETLRNALSLRDEQLEKISSI
jgi:integrase